jgi:hypothetical protein
MRTEKKREKGIKKVCVKKVCEVIMSTRKSDEELKLVKRGIKIEMQKIKSGKQKTKTLEQIKRKFKNDQKRPYL